MQRIREHFEKLGWKVIVSDETATQVMTSGFKPDIDEIPNYRFQQLILDMQLKKEDCYEDAARHLRRDKVLILFDRGVMDFKAYVTRKERMFLTAFGTKEKTLRDRYDAVFHLVTAAHGAAEFYTTDNNEARREHTIEDAIASDRRTRAAWSSNGHLHVIDNPSAEGGFDQKMQNLINEVAKVLGEPVL
jgi:predicted ATPase